VQLQPQPIRLTISDSGGMGELVAEAVFSLRTLLVERQLLRCGYLAGAGWPVRCDSPAARVEYPPGRDSSRTDPRYAPFSPAKAKVRLRALEFPECPDFP
jgi:hypothetical protein